MQFVLYIICESIKHPLLLLFEPFSTQREIPIIALRQPINVMISDEKNLLVPS